VPPFYLRFSVLLASLLSVFACVALAKAQSAGTFGDEASLASDPAPILEREEPWSASTYELQLALQPLTRDEIIERVSQWVELLKERVARRNALLLQAQQATEQSDRDRLRTLATEEQGVVIATIERLSAALDTLETRGGDVSEQREYVRGVRNAPTDESAPDGVEPAEPELSEEDAAAAEREARVGAVVEAIRSDLPVHERPEPWTISEDELRLETQPLAAEKIEERLNIWLDLLRAKARERNRTSIALSRSDVEPDVKARLTEIEGEIQTQIRAIGTRVTLLIEMLQSRGVDVTSYKREQAAALGQKLNWTNPTILAGQAWQWAKAPDGGVALLLNIAKFIVIVIIFWIFSKILGGLISKAIGRVKRGSSDLLRRVLVTSTKRIVLIIGIVVAADTIGIDSAPLLAAIGAAGLVIGLALQGTLSNFASGILILLNRPYDVGDVIDAGGVTGKVEEMSLVSTRIATFDNKVMFVPNNSIWQGVITNITYRPTRRVDLAFGISYADDIDRALEVFLDEVKKHPKVLDEPAPTIRLNELADSSVNFIVRPWARTGDYWDVYWDLMHSMKKRLDAEGISIPFPQRDVHLHELPSAERHQLPAPEKA
jgi:small conductance mechanosensitive channel